MPPLDLAEAVHPFVRQLVLVLELLGIAAVLGGVVISLVLFVRQGRASREWRDAYESLRANLGRGILLGLELLVAADIIATVTAPLTLESVGLLAVIVLIRTFLSFSLETEIEGRWPWRRADAGRSPEKR